VSIERVLLITAVCLVAVLCACGRHEAPAVTTAAADLPAPTRPSAAVPATLSHGRFPDLVVMMPSGAPRSFVILLSDGAGWDAAALATARELVASDAMVAAIDLAKLTTNLNADPNPCVFPDGDLENLSHFVQAYYRLPTYLPPLLVGSGDGAAFAYAMLAQAPPDVFAGALSQGFCPRLALRKPLCTTANQHFLGPALAGGGFELLPAATLSAPWTLIAAPATTCPPATLARFAAAVPGTEASGAATPLAAAFAQLAARTARKSQPLPPAALGDLPVIEVPADSGSPPGDQFALMMSGDGGWAGLDQGVAAALAARGIPVIGLDSLRYFWTARTPAGVAADTDRLMRYYAAQLGKSRVLLIGYSQGADVLPFAVNGLPAGTRALVSLVAVLGISAHALFEFHLSSWIGDDNSGPPTLPELRRLDGLPLLCVYGADEHDSPCTLLDASRATVVKLAGGHHFDGDYPGLARSILAAAKP
jgi:type IV secretory pathway VirJ component